MPLRATPTRQNLSGNRSPATRLYSADRQLVVPALYNLAAGDLLPDRFCLVCVARKGMTSDKLRDSLRQFATRAVDAMPSPSASWHCVTCVEADPGDSE